MRKRSKLVVATAIACSVVTLLSACGGATNNSAANGSESIINVYGTEPQNPLIPGKTNEVGGGNPLDLLFSRLVDYDKDGNTKNEVAQDIKASNNNQTFTITLKDGWKFTDGTPVTAQSFTKAWSYVANPVNASLNANFFSEIQGFNDLQKQGTSAPADAQLSGLKVVNDKTFTADLTAPDSVFPTKVGYLAFAPLPESFYKDTKAFGENPVGNGPYKFTGWNHNQSISMVKNPDYTGINPAQNGGITFKLYTQLDAAYADIQSGQLDALELVPASAKKSFTTDPGLQAINRPGSRTFSFTFPANLKHFQLDEEGRLRRQALSYAVDRQQIVDKVLGGTASVPTDFLSPSFAGYSKDLKGADVLTYNKDKAVELWNKANAISPWSDSDTVTFAYNSDAGLQPVFDAVSNSVANTLKVKSTTSPIATFSEYRKTITQRRMNDIFRTGWQPAYPSAEDYLTPLYSSSAADGKGANDGDYKNPAFDALILKAGAATSQDEALKDYQSAEELLLQDLPTVPLYVNNASGVAAKNVKGFELNWQNLPVYQNLTK